MIPPNEEVAALIVHHDVVPEAQRRYEAWIEDIASEAQNFAGHMGVKIIRPQGGGKYTIVLRFSSNANLDSWLDSQARKQFIENIRPALAKDEEIEVQTGLEYCFPPHATKPLQARPFKQFLISLSAIFPLTVFIPLAMKPVFQLFPWLGRPIISQFLIATIIVYLIVYVIMPRYTRAVAKWLFN